MHVTREPGGRRRLTDISMLRRGASGRVQAVPVWQLERGLTEHADAFRGLLNDRMPA
ncbi:hypothetical protein [Mycolicibacter minnesotensis]